MALNTRYSVVDYMKSKGMNSGYRNRQSIAKTHGIKNYVGSATQNARLLTSLRKPVARKPVARKPAPVVRKPIVRKPTPVVKKPAPVYKKPVVAPKPLTPQQIINNTYDQQKKSQLDAYRADQAKAIGDINAQIGATQAQYRDDRNQADVVSNQNAQRMKEIMAANGIQSSGENVSATAGLQAARLGAINGLNVQEQQRTDDYNRQITDLKNPSREQAMIADIEAQRNKALYQAGRDQIADKQWQSQFDQSNKQWQSQFNESRRQYEAEKKWREYQFRNMSASERAQLQWAKQQYGEDAAWRLFSKKYDGELARSQSQAELSFYKNNMGF